MKKTDGENKRDKEKRGTEIESTTKECLRRCSSKLPTKNYYTVLAIILENHGEVSNTQIQFM